MYYYVFSRSKNIIKLLRKSCEEEYEKITGLTKSIIELKMCDKRINSVIKAFDKLIESEQYILKKDNFALAINEIDINDYLSDYLFRVMKYLKNWETQINRQYGKDSLFLKLFKNATSYEYDNHMEYRIMYQLKNFDQHCNNIVASISVDLSEEGVRTLKVSLSKSKLLSEYERWKEIEKNDLASLDETIDALSFASEYNKCILRIHKKICNYFMNRELYLNCAEVLKFSNEFKEDRESISFVENEGIIDKEFWARPIKTLKFKSWCVAECYYLLLQHMENNLSSIKVAYHGDQYKPLLKESAIEANETDIFSLSRNSFVQGDDGKRYICGYVQLRLDDLTGWAILIDSRFGHEEIKDITSDYKSYIYAIINKQ